MRTRQCDGAGVTSAKMGRCIGLPASPAKWVGGRERFRVQAKNMTSSRGGSAISLVSLTEHTSLSTLRRLSGQGEKGYAALVSDDPPLCLFKQPFRGALQSAVFSLTEVSESG